MIIPNSFDMFGICIRKALEESNHPVLQDRQGLCVYVAQDCTSKFLRKVCKIFCWYSHSKFEFASVGYAIRYTIDLKRIFDKLNKNILTA